MHSTSLTRVTQFCAHNHKAVPSVANITSCFYKRFRFFNQIDETSKMMNTAFEPTWSSTSFKKRNTCNQKILKNVDYQQVRDWCRSVKTIEEIQNQKYSPERVAKLGANLAALHFFTYRKSAVKLTNSNQWITGSLSTLAEYLPHTYVEGYYVEGIDCSNFHPSGIRYEGLENLKGLHHLKWLSLRNQEHIDVWCLDRIAGLNGDTLEFLDISSCNLDLGCVFALGKMPALQTLVIKYPNDIETLNALAYLEYKSPDLIIKPEREEEELEECRE